MTIENTINGITWIDLTEPAPEDLARVLSDYNITIPSETILDFEMLPQLLSEQATTYCILRFPRLYQSTTEKHRTSFELDCLISKNLLISIHDIPLFEVSNVIDKHNASSALNPPSSSLSLFGILIAEFFTTVRKQLHNITNQLEEVESEIYSDYHTTKTLGKIAKIAKHLIDVERSVHASAPVMQQVSRHNEQEQSKNITIAVELFSELKSLLDTNRIILDELRRTHQNLIAQNTTQAVRNLTIITFLTLPISVLVDTMNIYHSPLTAGVRTLLLFSIVVITMILIVYFRGRRLL